MRFFKLPLNSINGALKMAYTKTTWVEHNVMSTTAKVNALNNAETQYDELHTLFDAHNHDSSYFTKTEVDAPRYFKASTDGSGSGLRCKTLDGYTYEELMQGVPSYTIAFWPGSAATIPAGWVRCDGTNDTPNLTNRFLVHRGMEYYAGETGGSSSASYTPTQANFNSGGHALTPDEMPAHTHTYSDSKCVASTAGGPYGASVGACTTRTGTTSSTGSATSGPTEHLHAVTSFTYVAITKRPAYYAGYWIMKT
jgi:hypothetical protein